MSAEREELRGLIQELPEEEVLAVLGVVRARLPAAKARPWFRDSRLPGYRAVWIQPW
jgi:hypothetical protein